MFRKIFLIIAIFTVMACSDETSSPDVAKETPKVSKEKPASKYKISSSGYLKNLKLVNPSRLPPKFKPANLVFYNKSEESKLKKNIIKATNSDGPYKITFYLNVQRGDKLPEKSVLEINLPQSAKADSEIEVKSVLTANEDSATARFSSYSKNWKYDNLKGSIKIIEIEEHITAEFNIENNISNNAEEYFTINGSVNKLEFSPQPESSFKIRKSKLSEKFEINPNRLVTPEKFIIKLGDKIAFEFDRVSLLPAKYVVGNKSDSNTVKVYSPDNLFKDVDGVVMLQYKDKYINGYFDLSSDSNPEKFLELEGKFGFVKRPDFQF